MFKAIEEKTNGAMKWKLVPGGQLVDGKTTFTGVKDGLIQAGLAIPHLCAEHRAGAVHDLLDRRPRT